MSQSQLNIYNLSSKTSVSEFKQLFETVGVVINNYWYTMRGFTHGFVEMNDSQAAQRAIQLLDQHIMHDRRIKVMLSSAVIDEYVILEKHHQQQFTKSKHQNQQTVNENVKKKEKDQNQTKEKDNSKHKIYEKEKRKKHQNLPNSDKDKERRRKRKKHFKQLQHNRELMNDLSLSNPDDFISSFSYSQSESLEDVYFSNHDLNEILESMTLSIEQKAIIMKKYFEKLKKFEKNEIIDIFDIQQFNLLNNHLINCTSKLEKSLLDIIEFAIGFRNCPQHYSLNIRYDYFNFNKQFYQKMINSSLLNKIELLIIKKIDNHDENKKYSDIIEQLLRIYLITISYHEIKKEIVDRCIKVLNKNLDIFLSTDLNKTNKRLSESLSKLFEVAGQFNFNFNNQNNNFPKIFEETIKQRIVPLLHVNCNKQLNCQFRYEIYQLKQIQDIQLLVFRTLSNASKCNKNLKDFLLNQHNLISHLIPVLNSKIKFNLSIKLQINNHLKLYHPSSLVVFSTIKLIYFILQFNPKINSIVQQTPRLISSLINIYKYYIKQQINQRNEQIQLQLKKYCEQSLYEIEYHSDFHSLKLLLQGGYISALSLSIATVGGNGQQKNIKIQVTIQQILKFLETLCIGRKTHTYYSKVHEFINISPQPILYHSAQEQIESEGGFEEIDAHLKNKWQIPYNVVRIQNQQKFNIFIHNTNIISN